MCDADWSENAELALTHGNTHFCSHQHFYQLFMASDQISCISSASGWEWLSLSFYRDNSFTKKVLPLTHTRQVGLHCGIPSFKSLCSVCNRFTRNGYFPGSAVMDSGIMWELNGEQGLRRPRREVLCKIQASINMQTPRCSHLHPIM